MGNKILKFDNKIGLYLVETNGQIVIVNNRISNKPNKNYKYWDYFDNQSFSLIKESNIQENLTGEALIFNNTKDLTFENYDFIYELILDTMIKSDKNYISDALNTIERYFKTIYSLTTKENLQGIFGEFLFIKYMQENNFDIQESYHKNDKSTFDFYFKNNKKYLEIKSSIDDIHEYRISYKQLDYDIKNTFLVTVNLWPDENGINFLELLDLINFKNPELIEKIEFYKEAYRNDLFVKETKYSKDKFEINIYDGNNLPTISFNNNLSFNVKNIKYDISTLGIPKLSLEQFINIMENN